MNDSHFARGRRLKPETRNWIETAGLIMLGQKRDQELLGAGRLALSVTLYGTWTAKNGKPRRVDLSNRIKILEDTVAKVCGFDDCSVSMIVARKVEAESERTEVDVSVLPKTASAA